MTQLNIDFAAVEYDEIGKENLLHSILVDPKLCQELLKQACWPWFALRDGVHLLGPYPLEPQEQVTFRRDVTLNTEDTDLFTYLLQQACWRYYGVFDDVLLGPFQTLDQVPDYAHAVYRP